MLSLPYYSCGSGVPECFTGCTSTVTHTALITPGANWWPCHLEPDCIAHRKVTSWWFISQGTLSTRLLQLLNMSAREADWGTGQICGGREAWYGDHGTGGDRCLTRPGESDQSIQWPGVEALSQLPNADFCLILNVRNWIYEVCKSRVELWH
jgi:hypothetical protein